MVRLALNREHFTAKDLIAVRKCGLQKEPELQARSHSQSLEGQADVCSLSPGKGSAFGWGKPVAGADQGGRKQQGLQWDTSPGAASRASGPSPQGPSNGVSEHRMAWTALGRDFQP